MVLHLTKAKTSTGRKPVTVLMSAAIAIIISFSNASKASGDGDFDQAYFNDRYDFVALLKIRKLNEMTNYKGSTLAPLGQVSVRYTAHSRVSDDVSLPPTPYEDFWYHDVTPIGCHRYREMPPQCKGLGAIRLLPSNDAAEFSSALANTAIRLLLDMNLHGCACQTLIVPKPIFGSVHSSFSRYGFYDVTAKPETPIPGRITLTMISEPAGESKYLYFDSPYPI